MKKDKSWIEGKSGYVILKGKTPYINVVYATEVLARRELVELLRYYPHESRNEHKLSVAQVKSGKIEQNTVQKTEKSSGDKTWN